MTEEQLRLECLKLAHSHGLPVTEVLAKAKSYEEFVAGKPAAKQDSPEKVQGPKKQKKDGSAALFE